MYFQFICLINVIVLDVQCIRLFSFHNTHEQWTKIRAASKTNASIHTGWIIQKLDHFDAKETRTWKMRYFKRLDFWRKNGPIYLSINGEGTAVPTILKSGLETELAKETNGAIFLSEHRYYGDSLPLRKLNVKALKFLTTPQALADNARLIKKIKNNSRFKCSKVVVIGGSYAGNLAAWMRLVYPNLVDAAIASSAPILAKRDFYEYFEVLNNDYKKYGTPNCLENIRSIFKRYDSLFQSEEGIRQLKREENVCRDNDLTEPNNKVIFFLDKIDPFIKWIYFAQNDHISYIRKHCDLINETIHENHRKLTELAEEEYWLQNKKENCSEIDFKTTIQEVRNDTNLYCWLYQSCTEYGFYMSSSSDNQPFTKNIPVEFYDKVCAALYGKRFNKQRVIAGIRKTNKMYGGLSLNVSKVVFVNGELDPWSSLSVLKDISPDAPAVYIPKATHCNDLAYGEVGPREVLSAKSYIKQLIKKWISDPKPNSFTFNFTIDIAI